MKIAHTKSQFRVLLTQEEYDMFGSSQLMLKINKDSVDTFIELWRVGHPHSRGDQVSFHPLKDGSISSKYQTALTKAKVGGKWQHLNTLPIFSPETVVCFTQSDGYWTVARPAMERVARQPAEAKSTDVVKAVPPPTQALLPKPAAQIMTREEYSDTAMYKSLKDGMALVNKAMAFYGERLVIEQRNGRLVALIEVTGE